MTSCSSGRILILDILCSHTEYKTNLSIEWQGAPKQDLQDLYSLRDFYEEIFPTYKLKDFIFKPQDLA